MFFMLKLGSTKNLVLLKKPLCQQKNVPLMLRNKVMRVTKKYVVATKKNYVRPNRRFMLTKYV